MEHQELLSGSIQLLGHRMIEDRARHGDRRGPGRVCPTLRVMERKPRLESRAEPAGRSRRRNCKATSCGIEAFEPGTRQAPGSAS